MNYLEKLQKETEIKNNIYQWQLRRKELVHTITTFYNVKGESFIKDLESLISKYESSPSLTNDKVLTQLINS